MNMKTVVFCNALIGLLLLGVITSRAGFAMGGYTPDQMLTGRVQSIDYMHHAITVNGQTYAVSAQAKFTGIGGFSVLHVGMPVECMLSSTPADPTAGNASPPDTQSTDQTPVIVAITWQPAGT